MKKNIFSFFMLSAIFNCTYNNVCTAQGGTVKQETMPVQESVMVTIEENFGSEVKTIVDALKKIERSYVPFDAKGRTFAILDAYGNKLPDGRYHISMHISAEKAGGAKLILSSTGKVLWNCNITANKEGKKIAAERQFTIWVKDDNEKAADHLIDGSGNPPNIFACKLNDNKKSITDFWKEGTLKEFIFIYSACGCPVHIKFLRQGFTSVFKSGDIAYFPDDVQIQTVIKHLMVF